MSAPTPRQTAKTTEQSMPIAPTRGCPLCHGTGWIETTITAPEGRWAGKVYPAVERCPCRRVNEAASH